MTTTVDVVVAGTGVAGLSAALTAHAHGLSVLVVERASRIGGSSALSGGGIWVPGNRFMFADGDHDTADAALEYMETVIGDLPPASTRVRKQAFVRDVPLVIAFLE